MIRRLLPPLATMVVVAACAVAVLVGGTPRSHDAGRDRSAASAPATLDLSLVAATMGQPRTQRLARWLNDLDADPADPADLRRKLRAALPGPRESTRTLRALNVQNRQLRDLIVAADRALAPVAGEHRQLAAVVRRVADLQGAVAGERTALDENLRALPATLRRLRPTLGDLDDLVTAAVPTVQDLRRTAPAAGRTLDALRAFAATAAKPLVDLGSVADPTRTTLKDAAPLLGRASALATAGAPIGRSVAALTGSLDATDGVQRILNDVYRQTLGINAYDDVGHYLRTRLVLSPCSAVARTPTAGCRTHRGGAAPHAPAQTGKDRALETTLLRRVLRGTPPQQALQQVRDRPGATTLRRRIARDDRRRSAVRQRAAKQAVTAGTSSASTRGQDEPIVVDGGLLPGADPKGDG